MKSLHIEGRRWFRRSSGGTFCSARIFIDGALIHTTPKEYGYGDYYLQAAMQWLVANGHAPEGSRGDTLTVRESLGGTYSVIDVPRERDL